MQRAALYVFGVLLGLLTSCKPNCGVDVQDFYIQSFSVSSCEPYQPCDSLEPFNPDSQLVYIGIGDRLVIAENKTSPVGFISRAYACSPRESASINPLVSLDVITLDTFRMYNEQSQLITWLPNQKIDAMLRFSASSSFRTDSYTKGELFETPVFLYTYEFIKVHFNRVPPETTLQKFKMDFHIQNQEPISEEFEILFGG